MPIYIFDKTKYTASVGEVISVSNPTPQYGITYTPSGPMPPTMTVDVKARVEGNEVNFTKLPATSTIADFGQGGVVVSESLDAILNEIEGFQKISENALADIPRHETIVAKCKEMKLALSPQAKKDAEQAKELSDLRKQVSDMSGQLKDMGGLLSRLLDGKAVKTKED